MRLVVSLMRVGAVMATMTGCHPAAAPDQAADASPVTAALTASRYQLDNQILAWCTQRKGLPGTVATCSCLADQLHVQRLPDDGARALVQVLYAVGPGSDPPLTRLQPDHHDRLSRAAELCSTTLP